MAKFPSTTLPQTNDPKEIQKGMLDLLDKVNRVGASIPGASGGGIKSVAANYAFTPSDGVFDLFVTTGASTITVTLDKSSRNVGRVVRVWKADAGAGEVKIAGFNSGGTAETISGYTNVYAGLQYQHADIYQDGTTNFNVGQYIQTVAGEPSLGTLHPITEVTLLSIDPDGTTQGPYSVKPYLPKCAKAAWIHVFIVQSNALPYIGYVVGSSASIPPTDPYFMPYLRVESACVASARSGGDGFVRIDENMELYVRTNNGASMTIFEVHLKGYTS